MPDRTLLHSMAVGMLADVPAVTPHTIREKVEELAGIATFGGLTPEDREWVALKIERERAITIPDPSAVVVDTHRPWLHEARKTIDWYYWKRYRSLLLQTPWPTAVVNTLDRATDRILDALGNPASEAAVWDRRGMVIGHVQSGKTSNYVGLMAKAADAGFKVIVVVAGLHEVLRSQTQARIDRGFLGWDSGKGLRAAGADASVGVGRIDSQRRPATVTSVLHDFNLDTARNLGITPGHLNEPLVLVVKKHPMPLQNLLDWLRKDQELAGPLLVIDDEADNASINIAYHRDEVTRINSQLRTLLGLFRRSAYVGYTATPFANIFIDPDTDDAMLGDDLFPRDFIVSLEAPSNYFGASQVFGEGEEEEEEGLPHPVLQTIDDHEPTLPIRHRKDLAVPDIPDSLKRALDCFIVACTIRIHRGDGRAHASMLVNASVFTAVQARIATRVFDRLVEIRDALRVNHGLGPEESLRNPRIAGLRHAFDEEYGHLLDWHEIFPHLRSVAESIDVEEVNSRATGRLAFEDYVDGRRIIAVGGYSLSRGLTLEGLIVSYFLRNSRTYDTLMQMARWFGYRDGYEDLCRVWMTDEAADWYAHIAGAVEELRDEVREMEARRSTPKEFGLRVRSHPDALTVTSRVKRGRSETLVVTDDLSTRLVETWVLPPDPVDLEQNRRAAVALVQTLATSGHPLDGADRWPESGDATSVASGYLLRAVPADPVVSFVRSFRALQGAGIQGTDLVLRYIRDRMEFELATWDVLIPSIGTPRPEHLETDLLGVRVHCQSRTARLGEDGGIYLSSRQRLGGRGMEKAGLSAEVVEQAEARFRAKYPNSKNVPDHAYRQDRTRPLLILHLINPLPESGPESNAIPPGPLVGWSLSFPKTRLPGKSEEYVLNATALGGPIEEEESDEFP